MKEAKIFKKVIDAMKDIVSESRIECNASGLSIQAMDSSHVSLCALSLTKEAFESFRCDKDVSIGISLVNLSKVLKIANPDDSLTLKLDSGSDKMFVQFENKEKTKSSDFLVKLMEIEQEQLGIPETKYDATIQMSSAVFSKTILDLQSLADMVSISVTLNDVCFSCDGDVGTANLHYKNNKVIDDDKSCIIEVRNNVTAAFSVRYLAAFTKATSLAVHVNLCITDTMPLSVEYSMGTIGYLKFFLAPKLEDDMNM